MSAAAARAAAIRQYTQAVVRNVKSRQQGLSEASRALIEALHRKAVRPIPRMLPALAQPDAGGRLAKAILIAIRLL